MAGWGGGANNLRLILTQLAGAELGNYLTVWKLYYYVCMYVSMRYKYIIIRLSRDTSTNTISKKRSFERHSCLNDSLVRYHHLQSKHRNQAHTMGQRSSFFVTWLNISISISKLLSNSSLRPRTRSWLYFPPMQQNHVNPLTKPCQPINKTTSTKNLHLTFLIRNVTMDMKFGTPK